MQMQHFHPTNDGDDNVDMDGWRTSRIVMDILGFAKKKKKNATFFKNMENF